MNACIHCWHEASPSLFGDYTEVLCCRCGFALERTKCAVEVRRSVPDGCNLGPERAVVVRGAWDW